MIMTKRVPILKFAVMAAMTACLVACGGSWTDSADTGEATTAQSTAGAAQEQTAQASTQAGQRLFLQCRACHKVKADEGHNVGPNLAGIVGRQIASAEGYSYSEAFMAEDYVWDAERLDAFLENPRTYIPRNKMAFAGVRKPDDRAALIAYLAEQTAP